MPEVCLWMCFRCRAVYVGSTKEPPDSHCEGSSMIRVLVGQRGDGGAIFFIEH